MASTRSTENSTDVAAYEANVARTNPPADSHVVDIRDEESKKKENDFPEEETKKENEGAPSSTSVLALPSAAQHPLEEIADSRGHLLQMKLWHGEEDSISQKIEFKETRIDRIRKELFHLSCLFFFFHGIVLTLFFSAGTAGQEEACHSWWLPSSLAFVASLALIITIEYKIFVRERILKMLQKDRSDLRAVGRCVQELRMKGVSYVLPKDPKAPYLVQKKMKSSSVEISVFKWCSPQLILVPIVLGVLSGLVLGACRLIACS